MLTVKCVTGTQLVVINHYIQVPQSGFANKLLSTKIIVFYIIFYTLFYITKTIGLILIKN